MGSAEEKSWRRHRDPVQVIDLQISGLANTPANLFHRIFVAPSQ